VRPLIHTNIIMPRKLHFSEPEAINYVASPGANLTHLTFATGNLNKLKEFKRILKNIEVIGETVEVDEIQSLDATKVVTQKAKDAWRKNNFNPIIVEDTSLEIQALDGRPGPLIKEFLTPLFKKSLCTEWLKGKDRRVIGRVLLAVYDGKAVQIREGKIEGKIAPEPRGANGFGFDDFVIPDGQTGKEKTFAEMSESEKDKFSMRARALEDLLANPFQLANPILMLHEPYQQELARVSWEKLNDEKAINFAYALECVNSLNEPNNNFTADKYYPVLSETNIYFTRYTLHEKTKSLGLILSDVDRNNLMMHKNGTPLLWQMGPERRSLALAQRADFFLKNQNKQIHEIVDQLEASKADFPVRHNRRSKVIERFLGIKEDKLVTHAVALKEIGYKKVAAAKNVSRTKNAELGLYNLIGKYPRSILGVGSMPPVSGWRDVITTAAVNFSPVFVTRNSIFAGEVDNQIALIKSAKSSLARLGISGKDLMRMERNIGAAIGAGNLDEELKNVERLVNEAEVKLFRIYTINSDPRVTQIARALRQKYGETIEIFVGQITEKKQALELISEEIKADALIFGHGGGRQCTSATNGMAITTLEEVYSVVSDPRFNHTTVMVEGGVGTQVGALLILGIDGILYNQQLTKGTIETGDVFFQHKSGKICQPYHGSASAATMIIESFYPAMRSKRISASGRAMNVEGTPGYTYYSEKANSMVFYLNEFKGYAARTFADLGVENFTEFRNFVNSRKEELLRIVTQEAAYTASPYGAE